jgi:hypothetical protein
VSTPENPSRRDEGPDPLTAAFTALAVAEAVLGVVRGRLDDARQAEQARQRAAKPARRGRQDRRGLHAI